MIEDKVYLTFKTTKGVSETLKLIAKGFNKTQPELIEDICIDFIDYMNECAKEALAKEGITVDD